MKRAFPILSYLVYIALAVYLLLLMQADLDALPEQGGSVGEDISIGLTEGFTKVFMVIMGAYGAVAVAAILVKFIHVGLRFWLIGILSALFDLVFTVVHGGLLVYLIVGEGVIGMAIAPIVVLTVISLISFIANTMTISD